MKLIYFVSIAFLVSNIAFSQAEPTDSINGEYHLFQPERSPAGGTTSVTTIQYAIHNNAKLLLSSPCPKKCVPATYTYQEKESQTLGFPVFFNSTGIYVIQYDDDSFVTVMATVPLGKDIWSKFVYVNFYSKDKSKAAAMTTEKIAEYAIDISKKM